MVRGKEPLGHFLYLRGRNGFQQFTRLQGRQYLSPGEHAFPHGQALGLPGFGTDGQLAQKLFPVGLELRVRKRDLAHPRKDFPDGLQAGVQIGLVAAKSDGQNAGIGILRVGAFNAVHPTSFLSQLLV